MSKLAEEVDSELQKLAPEQAAHFARVLRDLLALIRSTPTSSEGTLTTRRASFPITQGSPGVSINPTREQLSDF